MATIHHGRDGENAGGAHRAAKTRRLAALLSTLIVASVAVNALIILADGRLRDHAEVAGDCSLAAGVGNRTACDGNRAFRPAPVASGTQTPAPDRSL
jgi:hypothetical protein